MNEAKNKSIVRIIISNVYGIYVSFFKNIKDITLYVVLVLITLSPVFIHELTKSAWVLLMYIIIAPLVLGIAKTFWDE